MANLSREDKIRLFDILGLQLILNADPNKSLDDSNIDSDVKVNTFDNYFVPLSLSTQTLILNQALKKKLLSTEDIDLLNRYATESGIDLHEYPKSNITNPTYDDADESSFDGSVDYSELGTPIPEDDDDLSIIDISDLNFESDSDEHSDKANFLEPIFDKQTQERIEKIEENLRILDIDFEELNQQNALDMMSHIKACFELNQLEPTQPIQLLQKAYDELFQEQDFLFMLTENNYIQHSEESQIDDYYDESVFNESLNNEERESVVSDLSDEDSEMDESEISEIIEEFPLTLSQLLTEHNEITQDDDPTFHNWETTVSIEQRLNTIEKIYNTEMNKIIGDVNEPEAGWNFDIWEKGETFKHRYQTTIETINSRIILSGGEDPELEQEKKTLEVKQKQFNTIDQLLRDYRENLFDEQNLLQEAEAEAKRQVAFNPLPDAVKKSLCKVLDDNRAISQKSGIRGNSSIETFDNWEKNTDFSFQIWIIDEIYFTELRNFVKQNSLQEPANGWSKNRYEISSQAQKECQQKIDAIDATLISLKKPKPSVSWYDLPQRFTRFLAENSPTEREKTTRILQLETEKTTLTQKLEKFSAKQTLLWHYKERQNARINTSPEAMPYLITEKLAYLDLSVEHLVNKNEADLTALFLEQARKKTVHGKEVDYLQFVQKDLLRVTSRLNSALAIFGLEGDKLRTLAESSDEQRDAIIKKIYRKESLRNHPDKNPTEDARKNFEAIQTAYELFTKGNNNDMYRYLDNIAAIPEERWQTFDHLPENSPAAFDEAVVILNRKEDEILYLENIVPESIIQPENSPIPNEETQEEIEEEGIEIPVVDTSDIDDTSEIDDNDVEDIVLPSPEKNITTKLHQLLKKQTEKINASSRSDSTSTPDPTFVHTSSNTQTKIPKFSFEIDGEQPGKTTQTILESTSKTRQKFKDLLQKTSITFPNITLPNIFKLESIQPVPSISEQTTRFQIIKQRVTAFLNLKQSTPKKEYDKNNDIEMTPISLSSMLSPESAPKGSDHPPQKNTEELNQSEESLPTQSSDNHFNQPLPKNIINAEKILNLNNGETIQVIKSSQSENLSRRFLQATHKTAWQKENKNFEILAVKQNIQQDASQPQQQTSEKFILLETKKNNSNPEPKLEVFKGVVTSCPGQLEEANTPESQEELAYLLVKTFLLFPNKSNILEIRGGTPEFRQIVKNEALKQGFSEKSVKLEGIELPVTPEKTSPISDAFHPQKQEEAPPEEEYHSSMIHQ